MKIKNVKDFGEALKDGPYAWPGGYPLFFVTADGEALAFSTAWEERSIIVQALLNNDQRGGWYVIGTDINWEDPELMDDHTGKRIESAYAEDQAKGDYVEIPESYRRWQKSRRKA
jgi:hypothetical protein